MARVRHFEDRGRYGGNGVALDGGHGDLLDTNPNLLWLPFLSSSPKILRPVRSSSPTTSISAAAASNVANHRLRRLLHSALCTLPFTMLGEGESNTQPLTGTSSNSIHSKRTDVAWKHCTLVRENDTNEIFCNYCRKVMKGGIRRGKQHLIGKAGNVTACLMAPEAVKVEIRAALDEGCMEIGSSGDFSLKDTRKGPMDLYTQPQSTAAKNKKAKVVQAGIRELCDKKATERVYKSIARFWYQADIPFNLIKCLYYCINKLLGDSEMEKIVHKELDQYKAASGMFGSTTAKAMRGEVAPGGDDLTWRTVYQASGLDEPRQYTRRNKRKQVGSGERQVGTSTNLSKRAKGVAAKNKGKRVGVVEEAEASEDSSSEEDELVSNADFTHSDGEEAEGFLNEQNHHVEINYADIDDEEED
ncbi:Zinc finger, BED-type [Sesbania bispinosa]|nr:Zinc finger, BED-type [Sesbania bispinosa]